MAIFKNSIGKMFTKNFRVKLRRINWPPPSLLENENENIRGKNKNVLEMCVLENKNQRRGLAVRNKNPNICNTRSMGRSKNRGTGEALEKMANAAKDHRKPAKNTKKQSKATPSTKVACEARVKPVIEEREPVRNISAKKDVQKTTNFAGREIDIENLINTIDETDDFQEVEKENNNNTKTKINKKKCSPAKKGRISTRSRLSKVYDFDQEVTIEDHDPTKDIVKELIKDGKVRVATCAKGKGKPIIKRKPPTKKINKLKTREPLQEVAPPHENIAIDNNKNTDSGDADNEYDVDRFSTRSDTPVMNSSPSRSPLQTPAHGESTFSDLARTVLLHQTGKTYSHTKEMSKTDLVTAVRKFVSTPNNKSATSPSSLNNFSAINLPGSTPYLSGAYSSPWRIDKDENLPAVFNFSCNNSNLPSFSSDCIPPEDNEIPKTNAQNSNTTESLSSTLSKNDSNAENITPEANTLTTEYNNTNDENLLNLRQQANPLHGRKHRSPLKAINIIEVIQLPPWKTMPNEKSRIAAKSPVKDLTKSLSLNKNDNKSRSSEIKNTSVMTKDKQDLFGFEEFIDDVDDQYETVANNSFNTTTNANTTLFQKLKELKKWRPKVIQKPENVRKKSQKSSGTNLFDGVGGKDKTQRCINDMLCSTMINTNAAPPKGRTLSTLKDKQNGESPNLFRENSVENSFDDNSLQRTYIRPYKRKRKLRQNLVMYMDSDESGVEECAGEIERHDSHKRKYQRKEQAAETELNQFVQEFNSMCNEVQRFEVRVEKEV